MRKLQCVLPPFSPLPPPGKYPPTPLEKVAVVTKWEEIIQSVGMGGNWGEWRELLHLRGKGGGFRKKALGGSITRVGPIFFPPFCRYVGKRKMGNAV